MRLSSISSSLDIATTHAFLGVLEGRSTWALMHAYKCAGHVGPDECCCTGIERIDQESTEEMADNTTWFPSDIKFHLPSFSIDHFTTVNKMII